LTTPLNPPATIGVCLETDALNLPANQHGLLQLHRFEPANPGAGVEALPNVPFAFIDCSAFALERTGPIATFARALWTGIERHVGPWFSPPPLEAAHLGVGGLTKGFSNFGWGLPAKMTLLRGDNQTAFVGVAVAVPP